MKTEERTLAIIKPDAFQRKLVGRIIQLIERKGFRIVALKAERLSLDQAQNFYAVHRTKSFFSSLTRFMSSGPIIVMVLQGYRVIDNFRRFIGATDPAKAQYGTIRREMGTSVERNVIHGSDSPGTAAQEISFLCSADDYFELN